jgi:site-specific DNA recombinase
MTEPIEEPKQLKRAALYLRVSTKDQARRDGSAEGYSLPTQRITGEAKAESLSSFVTDEYLDTDTGTSTEQRPAMKALLERVMTKKDIDYVIVFKLDRWARNAREDLANDFILEQAGAELISCSERIDRSNAGRMMHTVLAAQNEYQSRNAGDEIRRKRLIKIQQGGTPGPAPLGYKNVGEGGLRWVEVEPEAAALVTWCFEAYATNEWSIKSLLEEATDRGMLSKGGPNRPKKKLTVSQMHRMLRRPYYKGIVTFRGVEYQGKHQPIVAEDVWDQVQTILDGNRNGEKRREHPHYLKGTIFCGHCKSRLCVTYSTGRNDKKYPYYFCVGRHQKRAVCNLKHRPLSLVESQIEEHYRIVQLTAQGLDFTADMIRTEIAAAQEDIQVQRQRQQERLLRLDDERTKLLQAHYAGAVPLDLMKKEQERIANAMNKAEAALAVTEYTADQIEITIEHAVAFAMNCHDAYMAADDVVRREMNQAFFDWILVTEDGVVEWAYNQPFAMLMSAHGVAGPVIDNVSVIDLTAAAEAEQRNRARNYCKRKDPNWLVRVFPEAVSKEQLLAEGEGFEPSVTRRLQRLSRPPHSSALATFRRRG